MRLLYSGAKTSGYVQTEASQSLGGLVSSTPIPNGRLNNIFPPISRESIRKNISDTRLIVLINGTTTITNLKIWTESGSLSSYEIAAVAPALNTKGEKEFEELYDGQSIPYQAQLSSAEGQANAILIDTVSPGDVIGIWIKRDLKIQNFTQLDGGGIDSSITAPQLQALLETQDANLMDSGNLIFDWS